MPEMPRKIWLGCPDTDNELSAWEDPDEGGTEYIRSDLVSGSGWNEAIEAASSRLRELSDKWAESGKINEAFALRAEAVSIRNLKRPEDDDLDDDEVFRSLSELELLIYGLFLFGSLILLISFMMGGM